MNPFLWKSLKSNLIKNLIQNLKPILKIIFEISSEIIFESIFVKSTEIQSDKKSDPKSETNFENHFWNQFWKKFWFKIFNQFWKLCLNCQLLYYSYARHCFIQLTQAPGETIRQFATRLRRVAKDCGYGTDTDNQIRDEILCKCTST